MQHVKRILAAGGFAALSLVAACGHHASDVTTRSAGAGQSQAGGTVLIGAGTDFYGKLQQPMGSKSS